MGKRDSRRKKGRTVTAPIILSVSRSTDIPAFYSEWLIKRLRTGFLTWRNPFNQKILTIDLTRVAGAVFWSKNPRPLLPYLHEIESRGIDYYFQFTVNDYENVGYEPKVPPLNERIATFKELSGRLGKKRVVWRFDPICISDDVSPESILQRLSRLAEVLGPMTERLVVSFVDVLAYRKVQNNIKRHDGVMLREPTPEEQDYLAEGISRIAREHGLQVSACGESRSYTAFGIPPAKCIDGALFAEICSPKNFRLQEHLGINKAQGSLLSFAPLELKVRKDKGQRDVCGCIESKDIGMYNTCGHMCVYCYANSSQKVVEKNMLLHRPGDEGIVPA
jgi:hypothetical protein